MWSQSALDAQLMDSTSIQQQETTPKQQPLLFAPSELRACGLRDAHTSATCRHAYQVGRAVLAHGCRRAPGSGRWSNGHALATSYAALGFDCDSRREAVERAAAACMGAGDLPTPNVYATRTASGHAQSLLPARSPGASWRASAGQTPHATLRGCPSTTGQALGADSGYTGVLSSNPIHGDYQTSYPRSDPYTLTDLALVIPKGWRIPRPATTAEGRNSELFAALCKLALRCSDDGLLQWARTINSEFAVPLADAEVRGTWGSVCRYRARWRIHGHQQAWLWKQAARGQASGRVRRAGSLTERQPWADLGVSRRPGIGVSVGRKLGAKTWGRRLAHEPIQVVRCEGLWLSRFRGRRPHVSGSATSARCEGEGGSVQRTRRGERG